MAQPQGHTTIGDWIKPKATPGEGIELSFDFAQLPRIEQATRFSRYSLAACLRSTTAENSFSKARLRAAAVSVIRREPRSLVK
jgi:hypothetical protein